MSRAREIRSVLRRLIGEHGVARYSVRDGVTVAVADNAAWYLWVRDDAVAEIVRSYLSGDGEYVGLYAVLRRGVADYYLSQRCWRIIRQALADGFASSVMFAGADGEYGKIIVSARKEDEAAELVFLVSVCGAHTRSYVFPASLFGLAVRLVRAVEGRYPPISIAHHPRCPDRRVLCVLRRHHAKWKVAIGVASLMLE